MDNILPSASGKKRTSFLRRAGCGCLGIFLLLALAVWVFGGSLVHRSIEEMAQQELGLPVSIGEVKLSILGRPSIGFRDLILGDNEQSLLKVKELTLSLSLDEKAFLLIVSEPLLTLTPEMWEPDSSLQRLINTLLVSKNNSKDSFAIPLMRIDGGRIVFTTPDKQSGSISIRSLSATNLSSSDHSFASRPQELDLTDIEVTHSSDIFKVKLNKGTISKTKTLSSSAFSCSLGDLFLSDLIYQDGSRASQQLLSSFTRLQELLFPSTPPSADSAQHHWEIKDSALASLHLSLAFNDRPGITCVLSGLKIDQVQSDPSGTITINALDLQSAAGTVLSPSATDQQVKFNLNSWGVTFFSFSPSTRFLSFHPSAGRIDFSFLSGKEEESLSLDSLSGDFEKKAEGILLRNLSLGKSSATFEIRKNNGFILHDRLSLLVTEWKKLLTLDKHHQTVNHTPVAEVSTPPSFDIQNIIFKEAALTLRDSSSPEDGLFVSLGLSNGSLSSLNLNSQARALGELKIIDSTLSFTQGKSPLLSLSLKEWNLPRLTLSATTTNLPECQFTGSHLISHIGKDITSDPVLLLKHFSVHLIPSAPSAPQMESCSFKDVNIHLSLSSSGTIEQQNILQKTNRLILSYLFDSAKDQTKPVTPPFNTLFVKALTTEGFSLQISNLSSAQPMGTHLLSWKDQDIQKFSLSLSPNGLIEQFSTESMAMHKFLLNYSNPNTSGLQLSIDSLTSTPFTYPFEKGKALDSLSLKECLLSSLRTKANDPYISLQELSLRLQSLSPLHIVQIEGSGGKIKLSYDQNRDNWDIGEDIILASNGFNALLGKNTGAPQPATKNQSAPITVNHFSFMNMQLQLSAMNNGRPAIFNAQTRDFKGNNLFITRDTTQPSYRTKELSLASIKAELPGSDYPLQLSSDSLSVTDFDSLNLAQGIGALSFICTELRTGDLSSPNNSPQVYIPSLQGSFGELSKQKIVIEDISCERAIAKMTLREDKSIDFFSLPTQIFSVMNLFSPIDTPESSMSPGIPLLLQRFSMNQAQLLLTDHFSSRDNIIEIYDFSQIWVRGTNIDSGGSLKGRIAAGALAGLVNNQGILPGSISFEAEELILPLPRNQTSFVLSARLERLPVQLIAPAILQLQDIHLSGDKGFISLSSMGSSTNGRLSFPVDLEFQGIQGKSVKSSKPDKSSGLSSVFGSLKDGAQGFLFNLFLANLTPQHKAYKNAFTIEGTLNDPKAIPNPGLLEKTGKQSIDMLKSFPGSILRPGGATGQEDTEQNEEAGEQGETRPLDSEKQPSNLLDLLNPKKEAVVNNEEEENGEEEGKSSKEEQKKKQVSELLNMGLELLKNAK